MAYIDNGYIQPDATGDTFLSWNGSGLQWQPQTITLADESGYDEEDGDFIIVAKAQVRIGRALNKFARSSTDEDFERHVVEMFKQALESGKGSVVRKLSHAITEMATEDSMNDLLNENA